MVQATEAAVQRCGNPECHLARDGECIEGRQPVESCPHYGKTIPIAVEGAQGATTPSRPSVPLQAAATLSVEEAEAVLKQHPSRVVSIVGPFDAGKTSLISGLYDLFQTGGVGQFEFASSLSLHAFEEAAHDSRAASRRAEPEMNRTPLGEVRFYHLELLDTDFRRTASLLLADRSGESYFSARNDPDSALDFPELSRCDVLTMLVDGARLASLEHRFNVISGVRQMLQAFVESGMTRPWQRLAIVVTKLDAVRKDAAALARASSDLDALIKSVDKLFGAHFAQIAQFRVAASPKSEHAQRGEGVAALLDFWFMRPLRYDLLLPERAKVSADRQFARLARPVIDGATDE